MSKSFKRSRQWDDENDDNDYRQKQKNNDRRKMKKMKNDLRSWKNISTRDLYNQDYED